MTERERALRADVAEQLAAVEQAAADLALGEEPAGFAVALEAGAPPPDAPDSP